MRALDYKTKAEQNLNRLGPAQIYCTRPVPASTCSSLARSARPRGPVLMGEGPSVLIHSESMILGGRWAPPKYRTVTV